MCIARVSFARRFKTAGIKGEIISTVHDSIVVDVPSNEVNKVCQLYQEVFNDIPDNFQRLFGKEFNLRTGCEISYGPNSKDLTVWTCPV